MTVVICSLLLLHALEKFGEAEMATRRHPRPCSNEDVDSNADRNLLLKVASRRR